MVWHTKLISRVRLVTRATEGITLWFYNLRSDAPDCLGGRRSAGGSKLAPSSKFLASASLTLPTTRGLGAAPESIPLSLRALLRPLLILFNISYVIGIPLDKTLNLKFLKGDYALVSLSCM